MINKIRLLFHKDKEPYLCFYRMTGFYPRNIDLYKQALLHKSSSIKNEKGRLLNNERLEFLGDAVLDAVVADIVYKRFEGKREGFLTNTRSKIVQRETLNHVARQIGLDKLVKFSSRQSSHNNYMGGNAFEALIGALYLDQGYRACKKFMEERIINQYLDLEKISRKEVNFKSKLIEWSQKNKFEITFKLINQAVDEDQNPVFNTQILVENIPAGSGKGYSKKESQQEAAQETLLKIKKDPKFIDAIFQAKTEREKATEPAYYTEESPAKKSSTETTESETVDIREEILTERYSDTEHIIAEAEEAAFKEAETNEENTKETV